jgi:head-tail adaptor
MAMRQAFVRSDLVAEAWEGMDHAWIDRENHELQDAITARKEAVAATARDRARYREDLAHITADEAAAQRARWDSSLAEAVVRQRRADVASFREQNHLRRERRVAGQARMRSDDGADPSGHGDGQ